MSALRAEIARAFAVCAETIATAIEGNAAPEYYDQVTSPFGSDNKARRRFRAFVKREGLPVTKEGNLLMVKRADFDAALAKYKRLTPVEETGEPDDDEALEKRLGLRRAKAGR